MSARLSSAISLWLFRPRSSIARRPADASAVRPAPAASAGAACAMGVPVLSVWQAASTGAQASSSRARTGGRRAVERIMVIKSAALRPQRKRIRRQYWPRKGKHTLTAPHAPGQPGWRRGKHHRPCFLRRGGAVTYPRRSGAFLFPPHQARGDGAPIGATYPECAPCCQGAAPFGAPSRRFPSGAGPRFAHEPLRSAFGSDLATPSGSIAPSQPRADLTRSAVSQLLAGGRSAPGRSPGAANIRALGSPPR